MRLNVRLNFWNSCNNIELDVSIVCWWLGICIITMKEPGLLPETELWSSLVFQTDCWAGSVEGWGGNEGARVTCGRFMEEIETHVLRIDYGIWVGKIVFLIFRICVNNHVLHCMRKQFKSQLFSLGMVLVGYKNKI